jgi:isoleucyl-tRNA synthetase
LLLGEEAGTPFPTEGNSGMWTALQSADVDGRTVRLALTKEGS